MAILYCDGERFRKAFLAGAGWLSENKERLNQLNVFPVPDGDTGTNMSLTLFSAINELEGMEGASLGEILEAIASGTLMGARGCSGVIFSQLLAGLAESSRDRKRLTCRDIAIGLQSGAEKAYGAVNRPVEGTILTVIRESSEEAARFARNSNDILRLLETSLMRAKKSLKNTPNILPVLAQAGVVDSGGQGFVYMLEGVLRLLHGEALKLARQPVAESPAVVAQSLVSESWDNPYCTEFILMTTSADIPTIRQALNGMGDSLVVVGWNEMIRVHIHTSDPDRVLASAYSYGKPSNVKIDDTRKQHRDILDTPLKAHGIEKKREISIVTTAPGDGLKAICMSLGAESVVMDDETRNPSVAELIRSIDDVSSDRVLLLPNDGNILPAATQAASMSNKQVEIIPSRNISQGLSALIAFRLDVEIADNISSMKMALEDVKQGVVALAVRNARYGDIAIKKGDIIGLFDGSVRVAEDNHTSAVLQLLRIMLDEDNEIISIFYSAEIERTEAEELLEAVEAEFPEMDVELRYGGQTYCYYILSVE